MHACIHIVCWFVKVQFFFQQDQSFALHALTGTQIKKVVMGFFLFLFLALQICVWRADILLYNNGGKDFYRWGRMGIYEKQWDIKAY